MCPFPKMVTITLKMPLLYAFCYSTDHTVSEWFQMELTEFPTSISKNWYYAGDSAGLDTPCGTLDQIWSTK